MKIKDIYSKYVNTLRDNNIPDPELECGILLSFLLDIDKKNLFFYFENDFTKEDLLIDLVKERLKGKPIFKIIGKKVFWEYDFITNENVLDPRSDSEVMIDFILNDFDINDNIKILDLGTGSGCLILTLLKLFKNATGVAVDINEKSLIVAKENAKALDIKNIEFIKSNWNDDIDGYFDLIISNPPYIKTNDINDLDLEVKKYDPLLALDGGNDGLDCYRYIASNISKNCKKNTKLYLEIGFDQKIDVVNIFNNFWFSGFMKDLSGKDRVLKFTYSGVV